MYAMQYDFTLPADYDMGFLRKRVTDAKHTLDDRAGLGLKAYLFRDRGIDASPVNQYACFYLWHDTAAMAELLFTGSGRFQNIIRAFGRPAVRHWTGVATMAGPARAGAAKAASRLVAAIPVDPDPEGSGLGLAARIEREVEALEALARRDEVHTAALAVDPHHWELVRFVLWRDTVPDDVDATERYEVFHLSTPGLVDLPNGRHW